MESPTPDPVLVERDGSVLVLTLNRPNKSNALEPALVDGLRIRLKDAGRDESIKVVVLTSIGRSFCAGLDLKHVLAVQGRERRNYLQSVLELFREVWSLPQPVVAAINGAAVAGGFDLANFCDLRVAAEDAVFAQTEILIELNAISAPLYHTIGLGHAKELALLGEKIPAKEAHRMGFVNRLAPPSGALELSLRLARTMAARERSALVATKRLTREMIDQEMDTALQAAGDSILRGMDSKAHQERLATYVANLGKR